MFYYVLVIWHRIEQTGNTRDRNYTWHVLHALLYFRHCPQNFGGPDVVRLNQNHCVSVFHKLVLYDIIRFYNRRILGQPHVLIRLALYL